jgi:RNA polymerase sigma factor (sigma-70 family)
MSTPKDPDELFHEEIDFAHVLAFSFTNTCGASLDELRQEARLALWDAAQAFDAEKGIPFRPFAKRAIRNRLIDMFRKARTLNRRISLTLDAPAGDGDHSTMLDLTPDENTPSAVDATCLSEARKVLDEVLAELPERQQDVLRSYMSGETGTGKALELGISKQSLAMIKSKAILRLKQKLTQRAIVDDGVVRTRRPETTVREVAEATYLIPDFLRGHERVIDALLPNIE